MKKIKVIKKGFSLIEILLALGMILFLTVAAFLIYNRVDTASYAKKINDDIRYSYSFYKNVTEGRFPEDFSTKKGCCNLSPAIDSSFTEINKKSTSGKYYSSPKKDEIEITAYSKWNDDMSAIVYNDFTYEINGNISPELCNSIITSNINSVKSIYFRALKKPWAFNIHPNNSVRNIIGDCEYGAKKISLKFEG